jgi:hypothetical protein
MGRVPAAVSPIALLKVNANTGHHFVSFNACPASGNIEYISDFNNNVVNIYAGKFSGGAPCGEIAGLSSPQGMFVSGASHELYVANSGASNILVFSRGAVVPNDVYVDPTGQVPADVTLAKDGTVIASNLLGLNPNELGSISTWRRGSGGGIFIGNFPMINDSQGGFVTVQKNGALFFNELDAASGQGTLWTGSCPLGVCGAFVFTGAVTGFPGGIRSADLEDVVQIDQGPPGSASVTYDPAPPSIGSVCSIGAGDAISMDLNKKQQHFFYADALKNVGGEMTYPGCVAIGTVPGNPGGLACRRGGGCTRIVVKRFIDEALVDTRAGASAPARQTISATEPMCRLMLVDLS